LSLHSLAPSTMILKGVDVKGMDTETTKRLTSKIAILEEEMERLWTENTQQKMELDKMSSTFKTLVALKNSKIDDLERSLDATNTEAIQPVAIPQQIVNPPSFHCFRMKFSGVSVLKARDDLVFQSFPANVGGVDWQIEVGKFKGESKGVMKDYLQINVKIVSEISEHWSCSIYDKYYLYSQDSVNVFSDVMKIPTHYTKESFQWKISRFIEFGELFRPVLGYVKDDSILLAVEITVYPLQTFTYRDE
ncbi:hypothetical protein PMAYCL1PPCAC_24341, partial [Pristionchus mayeri]